MALEFILGLKAGIGHNLCEAEQAMNGAKLKKEKIVETDSVEVAKQKIEAIIAVGVYPIKVYDGPPLAELPNTALIRRVTASLTRLQSIEQEYGTSSPAYHALKAEIGQQCTDPATLALTPFGYTFLQVENPSLVAASILDRHIILIDANNMHYWNDKMGYDKVSARLNAIGRALVQATRTMKLQESYDDTDKRNITAMSPDLVVREGYVNRTHGTAGDEFIVDLFCRKDDVLTITHRLFQQAYAEQRTL